ncbi:MAG: sigma-70 family RNA polymerase sigma factor [Xanthomonadales bacterium]|nr:sigma-70 family RNA polymerase sigma factor [Xanthomonadales bacterium]
MLQFATTRWSLIMQARGGPEQARQALESICRNYRRPVVAFIRHRGHDASEAEDLAQDFFTRLLERRWDTQADPERGRFRAFLLTSLRNFLANSRVAAAAVKRGGGLASVPIDDALAVLADTGGCTPEQAFERAWALTVIERSFERLREEAERAGKLALFERLEPHLGEGAGPADYRRLGEQLSLRPNTVAVTVHRLRARLRDLVRAELADQTGDGADIDQELRAMRAALLAHAAPESGSGGN